MTRPHTLIIAEAGVNHNGDLARAKALVHAAAEAGVDIVKFQTFSADRLTTASAKRAAYQIKNAPGAESQHAMLKRLELTDAMHVELLAHCRRHGIEFLSTGFDVPSLEMLVGLGLERLKVPSGEITNLPYLRYLGGLGKSVIVSTGMATLGEIEDALVALERAGTRRDQLTLLHCTTEYPAPMHEVNLHAMAALASAFGLPVGYSDHTVGIEVPVAAVALGACVIEKHFTLDRTLPGPDHKASLEPSELTAMVRAIRNVELALGDGIKRPSDVEMQNRAVARKSIVAARPIRAGDAFSAENMTTKRPGDGLSPMHWDTLLGRLARRDYAVDEQVVD